jgi:hypothetical protein
MRKILTFIFLGLMIFITGISPNVSADAIDRILGFWEGDIEIQGFKSPIFIEFTMGKTFLSGVEYFGYYSQNINLSLNNDHFKIRMPDGNVYEGRFTAKTMVGSASNGNTLKLAKKKKATTLKKLMKATVGVDARKILYIPASPKNGFDWPYFLALPSEYSRAVNKQLKQYLMIDTNNSGATDDYSKCLRDTFYNLRFNTQYSTQLAHKLGLPVLMPVFPRPSTYYRHNNEKRYFCQHSFTRDTATLSLILKDRQMAQTLKEHYRKIGFDINTLAGLDLQLIAMMKHALKYLDKKGYRMESKVFMCGFSASGDFVDRFTAFHPEWVKAVASGAVLDNMVLPLAEYKGEKLIFPIGIYDYQDINGKPFDMDKYNSVARLYYSGDSDTDNVVPFADCYTNQERIIIIKLWGLDILPRVKSLIELYGQSGGKGMFILDKGVGHRASKQMQAYMKEFFQANRDSDVSAYPIPKDEKQLIFTLFK